MKKLLAFVPLLAGGAWAGTTLVAGNQTEPAYNDLIAQLNQRSPVPFVVEILREGISEEYGHHQGDGIGSCRR